MGVSWRSVMGIAVIVAVGALAGSSLLGFQTPATATPGANTGRGATAGAAAGANTGAGTGASAATGSAAAAVAGADTAIAPQSAFPPAGNLMHVMRGMLFPSANIVFTVQTIDPGVKKPPLENTPGGFDWFTWGGALYSGWEVVDYAAVSLAESATLMLTPGRTCENGRPVPVTDPDWIKFSKELADAGRASLKASRSRNQDAVSESTNQLNDSCSNCHRVYRGRTHCVKAAGR